MIFLVYYDQPVMLLLFLFLAMLTFPHSTLFHRYSTVSLVTRSWSRDPPLHRNNRPQDNTHPPKRQTTRRPLRYSPCTHVSLWIFSARFPYYTCHSSRPAWSRRKRECTRCTTSLLQKWVLAILDAVHLDSLAFRADRVDSLVALTVHFADHRLGASIDCTCLSALTCK